MEPLDGIRIGDLEIWPKEHVLEVLGHAVTLTAREFDILLKLAEHPGWAYSVSQLAEEDDAVNDFSPESVTVLVSRIRKKLAAAGATDVIDTVRGIGYRLAGQPAHDHAPPVAEDAAVAEDADRELRDALWQLQEAVIDVERDGDAAHEREVSELLERARRAVDGSSS